MNTQVYEISPSMDAVKPGYDFNSSRSFDIVKEKEINSKNLGNTDILSPDSINNS